MSNNQNSLKSVLYIIPKIANPDCMDIVSLSSKLGPILCYTYLYFTAVAYPLTQEQKSLQHGNTSFYACESEEKIFFQIIGRL